MTGCKAPGAQEPADFVEIGLNQPFGKVRGIGTNFVQFTIVIEEDDRELPAKRRAFTLML